MLTPLQLLLGLLATCTFAFALYAFIWVLSYEAPAVVAAASTPEPTPIVPFWHNRTVREVDDTHVDTTGELLIRQLHQLGVTIKQIGRYTMVQKDGETTWHTLTFYIRDLCYFAAAQCFLGMNESDSGYVIQSTDGLNWNALEGPFHARLGVVCTETHAALLQNGSGFHEQRLLISTDLVEWTDQLVPGDAANTMAIYDSARKLCVVAKETGAIYESSDMVNWTHAVRLAEELSSSQPRRLICNANGMMMAASSKKVAIRKTGASDAWVVQTTLPPMATYGGSFPSFNHFDSIDGLWILSANNMILRSTDEGATWSMEKIAAIKALARNATTCVAVGQSVLVGDSWTTLRPVVTSLGKTVQTQLIWDSVLNLFVMLENGGRLFTSPDGIEWTDFMSAGAYTLLRHVQGKTFVLGEQIAIFDGTTTFAHETAFAGAVAAALSDMTEATDALVAVGYMDIPMIWRSTDDGESWTEVTWDDAIVLDEKTLNSIAAHDEICVAGGDNSGFLIRSTDSGATWSAVTDFRIPYDIKWIRWGNNRFLMLDSFQGTVWSSVNGLEWTHHSNVPDIVSSDFNQLYYDSVSSTWIVCDEDNEEQLVFTSVDDGVSWETIRGYLPTSGTIHYENGEWVMRSIYRVLCSADSFHWSTQKIQMLSHIDTMVKIGSAAYTLIGDGHASLYKTTRDAHVHLGHMARYARGIAGIPNGPLVVAGKRFVKISVDDGLTWTQTSAIADSGLEFTSSYDSNNKNCCVTNGVDTFLILVEARSHILLSRDAGQTWSKVTTPIPMVACAWTGTAFVGVSKYQQICFSPDGVTWESMTLALDMDTPNIKILSDSQGTLYLVYVGAAGVGGYVSTDRAVSWKAICGFYSYDESNLSPSIVNDRLCIMATSQMYCYAPDGQTYTILSIKDSGRAVVALDPDTIVVYATHQRRLIYT
jgi:photosystem II stability/assembly factor-like uncharacterized protein